MSSDDVDRTFDRFVAGIRVGEADLAAAAAAAAIDRTVVAESLVRALQHPEAVVRLRTAERIGRMADVAPAVLARLRLVATSDVDLRARAAGEAALHAHRESMEGTSQPQAPSREPVARLLFRRIALRGTRAIRLEADDPSLAPDARALVTSGDDESLRVRLIGLPPGFVGTLPTVRVQTGIDGGPADVATAAHPVASDGSVTIDIGREAGRIEDVKGWLALGIELVVLAD